jgi:hypothetical protein
VALSQLRVSVRRKNGLHRDDWRKALMRNTFGRDMTPAGTNRQVEIL